MDGAVYVTSKYRDKGVGSVIFRAIMEEARSMELDKIFLVTPDRASFYALLGGQEFKRTTYRGESVTIMMCKIGK